uniref:RecB family exonuclease n=1 Tax=Nakamurella sp. TaxID=1869182 RepID=UPI003B3A88B4
GGAPPPEAPGATVVLGAPAPAAGHARRPPPPIRPAGPARPVRVKGRADRIDRAPDGSLIIVDFKTGATVPSRAAVEQHAQLAVYQLARSLGAGRRLSGETGHPGGTADDRPGEAGRAAGPETRLDGDGDGDGEGDGDGPVADRPGGAELVYLRSGTPTVRRQPALDEAAGQFWIEQLRQAAEFLAAPHSIAVENRSCERCPVRSSCPLQPSGRQVTR